MKDKINRGIGHEEATPFDTPVRRVPEKVKAVISPLSANVEIPFHKDLVLGLTGARTVIPLRVVGRDGVDHFRIQYLVGDNWQVGEIPRTILQDLANAQALSASLKKRNDRIYGEHAALVAVAKELGELLGFLEQYPHQHSVDIMGYEEAASKALANLAKVQEGEVVK